MATPLATLARNFVRRDADGHRKADVLQHVELQLPGDLDRGADAALHPGDVEERLVDRQALDDGRGLLEEAKDIFARLGVRRHARGDDDGGGAEPACTPLTHGGAHAVGLRLIARRQHDAHANDDRAPAQASVVALLDGREERVQIGV